MELKAYQQQVINDLSNYIEYLQKFKQTDKAFNNYWTDKIWIYNPLTKEGMRPYQTVRSNINEGFNALSISTLKSLYALWLSSTINTGLSLLITLINAVSSVFSRTWD